MSELTRSSMVLKIKLLAKRDGKLIELIKNDVEPALKLFIILPIALGSQEVIELIERYGLMPADSIIALTCRQHGINTTATFEEDFKGVPWLKVIP